MIATIANQRRMPAIGPPSFAEAGLMAGLGADLTETWRRAATFVGEILKGARPGDIPIERVNRFRTIVNLKTAKALEIEIPALPLAGPDEVIE